MKVQRNAPCTCGSGRKYKKCCGAPANLPLTYDAPISRFTELVERLGRLPAPPSEHLRVYRGQTADFGKMLATGLRGSSLRSEESFRLYAHLLSERCRVAQPESAASTDAEILFYWAEAIAQHYGPGSRFLDVSHSVEAALWFALHKAEIESHVEVMGLPGPFNPDADILSEQEWIRHREYRKGHGWLYVFDAPLWDGHGYPRHGEVIDLSRAPAWFASSPRVRAQAGCLLAADPKRGAGDLSSCYACRPIPVAWPMVGAQRVHAADHEIFPPPGRDEWYRRFLSIPLGKRPAERGGVTHTQAIPVSLYDYDEPSLTADVRRCMITLPLRFLFPTIADMLAEKDSLHRLPDWHDTPGISDATVIVVETPILHGLPRGDSGFWNDTLVSQDIDTEVDAYDLKGQPAARVSLENVFVEFSPLEMAGWERVEQPGVRMDPLRGLWMLRKGSQLAFYLAFEILQPTQLELMGPLFAELNDAGRFEWRAPHDSEKPSELPEFPLRSFYGALTILRELSRNWKPGAIPALTLERPGGGRMFTCFFRSTEARLIRTWDEADRRPYYFLCEAESNEPFLKPGTPIGAFQFDSAKPWPECSAAEIRARMWETVAEAARVTTGAMRSGSAPQGDD